MSKRKTEKRREGLRKKEGNLLRNNAVTSTVQGAIACQKATLPAVCIKTTIKDGKEGAWAGHMEWALRGRGAVMQISQSGAAREAGHS